MKRLSLFSRPVPERPQRHSGFFQRSAVQSLTDTLHFSGKGAPLTIGPVSVDTKHDLKKGFAKDYPIRVQALEDHPEYTLGQISVDQVGTLKLRVPKSASRVNVRVSDHYGPRGVVEIYEGRTVVWNATFNSVTEDLANYYPKEFPGMKVGDTKIEGYFEPEVDVPGSLTFFCGYHAAKTGQQRLAVVDAPEGYRLVSDF